MDYSPTSETATKLAEMLQAEFELLLHSAGEQEVKQDSDAKKRARLNKAQKGTGDETEEGDKGKGKGKRYSGDGERPFCWIYGKTDAGCKFGSRCKFRHDKDSLERGRCFECGAVGHLQPQCPYKDGASSNVDSNPEKSRSKGNSPKGGKGGKGAKWGNAKKAEVAEGGDETANAGLDKGSASPSSPSTANQVLVEALEVLKSMKLSSEQSASSGDPSIRMLCGSGLFQQEGRVALVDTAATHLVRTLFPWECLPDTTVMVQSALGGVTMRITEKGTLIREDNGPLIIPLWLILEFGANLTVINGTCHMGAKSSLDQLLWFEHGCLVMDYKTAEKMVLHAERQRASWSHSQWRNGRADCGVGSSDATLLPKQGEGRGVCVLHVARVSDTNECSGMGMLDSGASHPLRSLRPGEQLPQQKVLVSLAVGSREMCITPGGTLVTPEMVDPLVPIGKASALVGLRVQWRGGKCTASHPVLGELRVRDLNGCPCLEKEVALQIIDEMDWCSPKQALKVARMVQGCPNTDNEVAVKTSLQSAARTASANEEEFVQACWRFLRWYYGDIPENMLMELLPRGDIAALPFNRHKRRRLARAKRVVVHLFSGKQKWHFPSRDVEVLELDLTKGGDLHNSSVWKYLLHLAAEGKVVAVVGGPPCRTVSRLRGEDGGPPVLRRRCGPERLGLKSLPWPHQELAQKDGVLLLKMLFLYDVAVHSRCGTAEVINGSSVFFGMESPGDPELIGKDFSQNSKTVLSAEDLVDGSQEGLSSPTFWSWPEVKSFCERYGMYAAHFDQGALGHALVKPTTFLVSDMELWESLEQVRVVVPWSATFASTLEERLGQSSIWARWAFGLVKRIRHRLAKWLHESDAEREAMVLKKEEREGTLRRLTAEERAFRDHCLRGHIPFRRDCQICVSAAGKERRHLRRKHGDAYTLSLDLAGPYKCSKDAHQQKPRHAVIGVYQFPMLDPNVGRPPEKEEDADEVEDQVADDGTGVGEWLGDAVANFEEEGSAPVEPAPVLEAEVLKIQASEKSWKELKDHLTQPVRMINFVMVEPIVDKQQTTVLSAVQRMMVRLQRHGYPVLRIHSDRAGEFVNARFRSFCETRLIYRTTGDPGVPQTNGRAEACVGLFKRGVRSLLKEARLGPAYWALAARHWSMLRWQKAERELGLNPKALLPFGAQIQVRRRPWELLGPDGTKKGRQWVDRTQPALLLGPCDDLPGGYWVEAQGTAKDPDELVLFPCTTIFSNIKEPPELELEGVVEEQEPSPPEHRLKGKKPALRFADEEGPPLPPPRDPPVRHRLNEKSPASSLRGHVGSLRLLRKRGESPPLEIFEDDMQGLGELEENADVEDNVPGDEYWPTCCSPHENAYLVCKSETAGDGTQLEKEEQKAKSMYGRSMYDYVDCEELLEGIVYPKRVNRRGGINNWCTSTRALVLGHYTHGGVCGITKETYGRPWLCRYLASFVRHHNPEAKFSALQISCNAPVSLHRDSHNEKHCCNYVCGFGDYKDGQLWVEDEKVLEEGAEVVEQSYGKKVLPGKLVDIHWNFMSFFPRKLHGPMPWKGNRVSLTGYTPVFMERLSYKDRCYLLQCKFPLPEPQAEEGKKRKWLKMTLKETSLDDLAEEVDYAVFEAHQWALEEHLSIRRLIAEQECCILDEFHGSANESNEEKGSETREWLVKAKRAEEQLSKFLVKAAQVQQMVQENTALEAAEEVEFLQTKTIPTQEAMQELEKWRESLSDEVTSLVKELEVVEPTTQEKLDKLAEEPNAPVIEYVPSLVVFTRKQGTGRRRARICACGNFISSTAATEYEGPRSLSRHSLYAPGLDSTTFRCQVRHAAYMVWIIAGLDISKAFLTAPMNK